jgi:hypothetical protein
LRESIEHTSELTLTGAEGIVGSNDMIALYQEMGTSRGIPPRSSLGEALNRSGPKIETAFGDFIMTLISVRNALR